MEQKQLDELTATLGDIHAGVSRVREHLQMHDQQLEALRGDFDRLRRLQGGPVPAAAAAGRVSEACARHLAAVVIAGALKSGRLDALPSSPRENLAGLCREVLGAEYKAALTATDIPLPTQFSGEIVELVAQYGAARRYGTVFPLGAGVVKLPRLKTDPVFGLIAMSAGVPEKSPQLELVTLSASKWGGLIRLPAEIEADSVVAMGQFLARYAARQLARIEDVVFFTADGTGTYDGLQGLTKSTLTNGMVSQMAATKTRYSDSTLGNWRALRAVPDAAVLGGAAYYCHPSFEQHLAGFNTSGDRPYNAHAAQGATLDGFPVRWVDTLPPYSTAANAAKVFALFGDLSYQYLAVRGGVNIAASVEAAFSTDEILVRALERFTIGLMATGAVAGLQTAAS
ncbi:MAG: phage major capsid protein [Verrucomicrobiae bacterium]|nr:phage major capsid protein [Verrucomicrobiae bacterium]